jgi:hypothetical protein
MEKITIKKLKRQDMPSKFKEGDTYKLTTVLDDKGRKMSATGKWAENWKAGDVIEANVEQSKWVDRNGNENINLKLTNPNPSTFNRGNFASRTHVDAALIAVQMFPLVSKKKASVDSIFELAEEIKAKLDEMKKNTAAGKSSKSVDVEEEWDDEEEEKPKNKKDDDIEDEEDDDNDLPF